MNDSCLHRKGFMSGSTCHVIVGVFDGVSVWIVVRLLDKDCGLIVHFS